MKTKLILFFLLVNLPLMGQELPTIGEIFDFQVNDEFHFSQVTYPYDFVERVKYLERIVSPDDDSIIYVRKWCNYHNYQDYDYSYVWYFKEYIDTLIISDIDSSILWHSAVYEGLDPSDEDLYLKVQKYDWDFCTMNTVEISGIWSEGGKDTTGAFNPGKKVYYAKGFGSVKQYLYRGGGYEGVEDYEMFYYNKGDSTCGVPDTTTRTTNVKNYDDNSIKVYPNPTKNTIYIQNLNFSKDLIIQLYDTRGMILYENKNKPINNITVDKFLPGVYYLKITQPEKITTLKILKQ